MRAVQTEHWQSDMGEKMHSQTQSDVESEQKVSGTIIAADNWFVELTYFEKETDKKGRYYDARRTSLHPVAVWERTENGIMGYVSSYSDGYLRPASFLVTQGGASEGGSSTIRYLHISQIAVDK